MLLITGATGLLGAHTIYRLLQSHDRVAALRRPSSNIGTVREIFAFYTKNPDELISRIEWREGDMLDKDSLRMALDGISTIVNCAAIVSFSRGDRARMIENNVAGVRNLAEVLKERETDRARSQTGEPAIRLIHISSTSALGDGPGESTKFLIDEETPRDPKRRHSGYSVSKYESERVLKEQNISAVMLNPGIILGPGQWKKGSSQLFVQAWNGLKYYPYGGTGYVDVRDVAEIISILIDKPEVHPRGASSLICDGVSPGENATPTSQTRYCLVGANLRYREFFNLVTDEYGRPNPITYAGKYMTGIAWRADALRSFFIRRPPLLTRETAESAQRISFYSSEKIKKALDFEFRPIEETLDWVAGWLVKSRS
jgi:dihydroflavonol-4-reductase